MLAISNLKNSKHSYYLIIDNDQSPNEFLIHLASLDHIHLVNLNYGKEINFFFRVLKRLFTNTIFYDLLPLYRSEKIAKRLSLLKLNILHFLTTTIDLPYNFPDKTKILLTVADIQHEYFSEFFTALELQYRRETYNYSINKADKIITISNYTADTISEIHKIDRKTIETVYINAGRQFFSDISDREIQDIKVKYNLPDKFLFYPGHPWKHKNHVGLIKAIIHLKESFDLDISLVTSGQLKNNSETIESIAESLLFPMNKIHNIGFIKSKELPAIYRLANLLVYPSFFEGFGIPVLEALISGCPVVCSNLTSIPEVGGDSVIYVDPYSYKDIARGISDIINNKNLRDEKIKSGLLHAKNFDEDLIIEKYLNIYDKYD